jgi:hypothetical protein
MWQELGCVCVGVAGHDIIDHLDSDKRELFVYFIGSNIAYISSVAAIMRKFFVHTYQASRLLA